MNIKQFLVVSTLVVILSNIASAAPPPQSQKKQVKKEVIEKEAAPAPTVAPEPTPKPTPPPAPAPTPVAPPPPPTPVAPPLSPEELAEREWRKQAETIVDSKTLYNAHYRVFQVPEPGYSLCTLGSVVQTTYIAPYVSYNGNTIRILSDTRFVANGDEYRDTLYWCGTYTYQAQERENTVHQYVLNRELAINIVRLNFNLLPTPVTTP